MSLVAQKPTTARLRGYGLGQLLRTELKLLLREPMLIFWALAFPIGLEIVLGSASGKHVHHLGGLTLIEVETPVTMMFTLTLLSLSVMPATLASYRDKGYLRRLATTPVGAPRLLAAQLALILSLAVSVVTLLILISHFAYNVPLPRQFPAFLLIMVLDGGAMAAIGLFIAAVATSQRIAGAVGGLLFFPMMFFAGLWVPQQQMGETLRTISHYTPLGAAVPAIENTFGGQWAGTQHVLVLLAYALVFSRLAIRFFRWDR